MFDRQMQDCIAESHRRLTSSKALLERLHTVNSAQAKCTVTSRVLVVDYRGVISLDTMRLLDRMVLPARMSTGASLESTLGALTMFRGGGDVDRDVWTSATPPSAAIVRPDQMDGALIFVQLLAKLGVRRTCWLEEHRPIAQAWLAQYA